MLSRRAATLVELLVALTLAGVVLGAATTSVLRQQRAHVRIVEVSGSDVQLRAATSVLAGQLALLDPASGDLVQGKAEDSVLQLRSPVAASIACDGSVGSVTLLPNPAGTVTLGGTASLPRIGDSLWWFGDSAWSGTRISGVVTMAATCLAPIPSAGDALHLVLAGSGDTIPAGAALRVTRQARYGVYRSSDGTWQLGFREWNEPSGSFAAPQPLAGPLLFRVGGLRSGFRYFDALGQELAPSHGTMDTKRVARIRITTYSLVAVRERGQDSVRSDSVDAALQHVRGP
jgi:type II secretory pathway pseudopilin PulG